MSQSTFPDQIRFHPLIACLNCAAGLGRGGSNSNHQEFLDYMAPKDCEKMTAGQAKSESVCSLTPDMQSAFEALIATRTRVGIPSENPYVFARVCEAFICKH